MSRKCLFVIFPLACFVCLMQFETLSLQTDDWRRFIRVEAETVQTDKESDNATDSVILSPCLVPSSLACWKHRLPDLVSDTPPAQNFTSVVCDAGDCCDGHFINRSCVWRKLYYFDGLFHAVSDRPEQFSPNLHMVASGIRPHFHHPFFFPALSRSVPLHINASAMMGTFLMLSGGPHWNPGHAMLDELYSIWQAACKHGFGKDDESLTCLILSTGLRPESPAMLQIFNTVLGGCIFQQDWPASAAYVFERVVVGMGQMGLSTPGTDYVMSGRKVDALRQLRARFYSRYGVPAPVARASSMENRTHQTVVLVVPNRRPSNGVLDMSWGPFVEAAGFEFAFLDWSLPSNARLELLRRADVAVTGVGTGACNLFLLGDGAVIVNLGTTERSGSLSFQEEYLFAAIYWVRMVYPTYEQFRAMGPGVALDLVRAGAGFIQDDFDSSPSAPGERNLSPIGKAAAEYFSQDVGSWSLFVARYTDQPIECMNWAERVLCEVGSWQAACGSPNRTELGRLRQKYGLCCACS